jgi:hypothetical protein
VQALIDNQITNEEITKHPLYNLRKKSQKFSNVPES